MPTTHHIQVRDARDRVIDLLKIGQTYPLRDLAVPDDQLTVPIDDTAHVAVEDSQQDVTYQLHDKDDQPVIGKATKSPIQAPGDGATVLLETNTIQEDITFKVYAQKQHSDKTAYLHQTATVKVGLNTKLNAWMRDVSFLDPSVDEHNPADARIIDYDQQVEVEVEMSQEGVDYTLVQVKDKKETILSITEMRGDRNNIILRSQKASEDTDIRIRATKTFDVTESERRPTQTALLDVILALKVRANTALPASAVSSIIDFNQSATITLKETQASTQYQLYVRRIPDAEFVRQVQGIPAETAVIQVSVENKPDVQVRKPERQDLWQTPQGYTAVGDFQDANGGELQFTTTALTEDSLVIVQARKKHQATPDVLSAVQLEQAVVVLVRPNPASPLELQILPQDAAFNGELQVSGGQPGVLYYFRRTSQGEELGLPAYFHQKDGTDTQDAQIDKGVGQIAIGVDFVVARADSPGLAPVLDIDNLKPGNVFYVRAVKAQTGVETALDKRVGIPNDDE